MKSRNSDQIKLGQVITFETNQINFITKNL